LQGTHIRHDADSAPPQGEGGLGREEHQVAGRRNVQPKSHTFAMHRADEGYYGAYSNKIRGMRAKAVIVSEESPSEVSPDEIEVIDVSKFFSPR